MTIVVTGATGQLGRLVIDSLLVRGTNASDIVATGRDRTKLAELASLGVQTREAAFEDTAGLRAAFQGATRVLLVSGNVPGARVPLHANVIAAAVDAGVELFAYTSISHADTAQMKLAADHRETERLIRESGLPAVFLRNSWYLENYTGQIPSYLASGVVLGCAGDGRVSAATRADYAEAAAAVLLSGASQLGDSALELGGTAFSLSDLAQAVNAARGTTAAGASGKAVAYHNVPETDLVAALVDAGVPIGYAEGLADADRGIARGELEVATTDLDRLLGRPATTMPQAVDAALA